MSNRLSGVVDLDIKRALNNARTFRGELIKLTKTPTKVTIGVDDKAQGTIRKLKNDVRGLTKLGPEHKVKIQAVADVKDATTKLGKLGSALKAVGKNPHIKITVDLGAATRAQKQLSDAEKLRREQNKQAAAANKQALIDEQRQREANSRRLRDDIRNRAREEQKAIRDAERARQEADRKAKRDADALGAARRRAMSEGKAAAAQLANGASMAATRGGLAIIGGLGLAVREAIKFEDAFAGVRKTVKASDADLDKLSGEFRKMSREIPVTSEALSGIGQTAGQLGIKVPNIAKFTRTIADLGVATNLTYETGSLELAKFINLTHSSQKDVDRFGATIVDLGNNFSTTERDILSMSLRIAQAAPSVKVTQREILGLATALSSLGQRTEAGGTAGGKLFIKLEQAARNGGDSLKIISKLTGQTGEQFKKSFEKDATGALVRFVKGIAQLKKEGGDVFGTLNKLGMSETRLRGAVLALSNNTELLERALGKANTAWKENTALTREAGIRYKTSYSQMIIAINKLKDFGVIMGGTVLPPLVEVLQTFDPLLDSFRGLSKESQVAIVKGVAYAGVTLLVIGRLKPLADTLVLVRNAYLGVRAAQALAAAGGASSSVRIVAGLGRILVGTQAATVGFKTLSVAGIGGMGALGVVIASVGATIWGVRTAYLGAKDAGTMAADKLQEKWGIMADIWIKGSDGLNSIVNQLSQIAGSSAWDKLQYLVPGGVLARPLLNMFSTADPTGDAAEKRAKEIHARGLAKDRAKRFIGPQPYFNAYGPFPAPVKAQSTAPKTTPAPIGDPTAGTGGGKHKKTDAERAAEKAARDALRREKDAVGDAAKAYEYKAQAAKKSAQIAADATQKELDKLKDLKEGFAGLFTDAQNAQIEAGVITNPFGKRIEAWQKFLGIATEAQRKAAAARAEISSLNKSASDATNSATNARSQSERLSGLDGVVPVKGGGSSSGQLPSFLKLMANKTGDTIGLQCGATITEFLHRAGIRGTATSIARSGNARPNADGTYAPGTIFNFKGGKGGYRVNHYATVAPDGQHWLESNWAGKGQRPNMITAKRRINWARDIGAATWGGRKNIGQPSGVYPGKGGSAVVYRGSSSGGYSGGGEFSTPEAAPWFDTSGLGFSGARSVGKGWGRPVKDKEGYANRFKFQAQIAKGELDGQLAWMKALIQQGRAQGRTMGPYAQNSPANGLMGLAKQGININWKKGWTLDDVALDALRQEANLQDLAANAITKRAKAEEKATKAKEDAKEKREEWLKDVKNVFDDLKKEQVASNIDAEVAQAKKALLASGWDQDTADRVAARREFELHMWRDQDSSVARLYGMGFKDDASRAAGSKLREYDAKAADDAKKKAIEDAKELGDAYDDAIGKFSSLKELVNEAKGKLGSALADPAGSAQDLSDALKEVDSSVLILANSNAPDSLKTKYSEVIELINKARTGIIPRSIKEAKERSSELLEPYKSQGFDIKRQLEEARLSRLRPLTSRQSQELDWKYEDLTRKNDPLNPLSKSDLDTISKGRDDVRTLLDEWDKFDLQQLKITNATDSIGSAFDSLFENVISGQKSFGASLRDGFQDTLMGLAADLIKSQFRSLLTNLLTGVIGGKGADLGSAVSKYGLIAEGPKALVGATGIPHIAKDNTVIVAHAGERLLNAAEAESYRQQRQAQLIAGAGSRGGSGGNTYINYGEIRADTESELYRQMEQKGRQGKPQRGPRRARFESQRGVNIYASGARP